MSIWAQAAGAATQREEAIAKSHETLGVEHRIVDVEVDDHDMGILETHYRPKPTYPA